MPQVGMPEHLRKHCWKPGQSGNPSGPRKGLQGGRSAALHELDVMLADADNLKALRAAFQERFSRNPFKFFKDVVMPLLPKHAVSQLSSGDKVIEWRGLLTVGGTGDGDAGGCGPAAPGVVLDMAEEDAAGGGDADAD